MRNLAMLTDCVLLVLLKSQKFLGGLPGFLGKQAICCANEQDFKSKAI